MSDARTTSTDRAASAGARKRFQDVHAGIVALARTAPAPHAFFTRAFRLIAEAFESPYAAITVRHGSEITQDDCHRGSDDPGFWKAQIDPLLGECVSAVAPQALLLNPGSQGAMTGMAAVPVLDGDGAGIGAVAMVFNGEDRQALRASASQIGRAHV